MFICMRRRSFVRTCRRRYKLANLAFRVQKSTPIIVDDVSDNIIPYMIRSTFHVHINSILK